ncbi:MAG: hypothetical protein ACYDBB_27020 [Armatimonadota bacterium]
MSSQTQMVSDGIEYKNIESSTAFFTPDSRHLVFLANNGEEDKSERYRVAAYIDGIKVSEDYPGLASCLRSTANGTIQVVCQKTITPKLGKPYQAVVRIDMTIGSLKQ